MDGPSLETLFLQEIKAINDYAELGYQFYYWRTQSQIKVDFIAYGQKGFHAFEIKRRSKIKFDDLKGLLTFKKDYPMAQCYILYGGTQAYTDHDIQIIPMTTFLKQMLHYLT